MKPLVSRKTTRGFCDERGAVGSSGSFAADVPLYFVVRGCYLLPLGFSSEAIEGRRVIEPFATSVGELLNDNILALLVLAVILSSQRWPVLLSYQPCLLPGIGNACIKRQWCLLDRIEEAIPAVLRLLWKGVCMWCY